MQKLTPLDAGFLLFESPRICAHVSAVAIIDPSTAPSGSVTLDDLRASIEERLHLVPLLRQRVVEVPLGIDQPYWIEDPDFDLDFHLRELALPAPGSRAQLTEQVGRIFSRQLDRARPLWELYLIHGLEGGRMAILTKIHHAAVDGVSGAEMLGALFDLEPGGRELDPPGERWAPESLPHPLGLMGRGLAGLPGKWVRRALAAPAILANLADVPVLRTLPGASALGTAAWRLRRMTVRDGEGALLERPDVRQAPRTPLNVPISAHRYLVFGSVSLDEVKEVKNAFGTTVNDVVLAICAGALRGWLDARDRLPDEPLLAMIPVSVRTDEESGSYGNRVSAVIAPIPTHEADRRRRLELAHEAMRGAKERHQALPANLMTDVSNSLPPALLTLGARAAGAVAGMGSFRPPFNVHISNVPGPPIPLYCVGGKLEELYPLAGLFDGMGLNFNLMSYCGRIYFGLVTDRAVMGDAPRVMENLETELGELLALARAALPEVNEKS